MPHHQNLTGFLVYVGGAKTRGFVLAHNTDGSDAWKNFPNKLPRGGVSVLLAEPDKVFGKIGSGYLEGKVRNELSPYILMLPDNNVTPIPVEKCQVEGQVLGTAQWANLFGFLGFEVTCPHVSSGRQFPLGALGRIMAARIEPPGQIMYEVAWKETDGGEFAWRSPLSSRWRFIDRRTGFGFNPSMMLDLAQTQAASFKPGELVSFVGIGGSRRVAGSNGQNYNLRPGTVLKAVAKQDHYEILSIPEAKGVHVAVGSHHLVAFPHPYFEESTKVRVKIAIKYRQRDLQTLVGRVVLPPDADGDVGVQFFEDIGAGSLDGIGQDGHCLYVPAKALESVTE